MSVSAAPEEVLHEHRHRRPPEKRLREPFPDGPAKSEGRCAEKAPGAFLGDGVTEPHGRAGTGDYHPPDLRHKSPQRRRRTGADVARRTSRPDPADSSGSGAGRGTGCGASISEGGLVDGGTA